MGQSISIENIQKEGIRDAEWRRVAAQVRNIISFIIYSYNITCHIHYTHKHMQYVVHVCACIHTYMLVCMILL